MSRTIYFFGGEDGDFTSIGTTSVDTTSGHYRSSYCRCGLQAADGASGWDTGNFGSLTDFWVHARVYMGASSTNSPSTTASTSTIKILDASGTIRLIIYVVAGTGSWATNSGGNWRCAKTSSTGTATVLGSAGFSGAFTGTPASPDQLDVQISNYAIAGSGAINIWINGTLVFSATGQTLATDSNTTLSAVRFCGVNQSGFSPVAFTYSEVLVADSDTRWLSLATLAPAANGNADTWDTGGVSNINETTLNDTTLNASGTAGQVQQYTIGSLPSGSFGVVGLGISARAQAGSVGGPTKLDLGYRTGSTDYWSSDLTLPIALGRVASFFQTNSNTSGAFTTSDLAAVGFNVGMKSVT